MIVERFPKHEYLARRLPNAVCSVALILTTFVGVPSSLWSQLKAPDYYQCRLDAIFPAGGQRGTSVSVELRGRNGGLASPREIIIDGPPGITVSNIEAIDNNNAVKATLTIAKDAPFGRRWVRVASEQSGLTNFAHFVVGSLPEHIEKDKNNTPESAEELALPTVVNGRINPKEDIDCYRFKAKKDQKSYLRWPLIRLTFTVTAAITASPISRSNCSITPVELWPSRLMSWATIQ